MIEKITDQNLEKYDSRLKEWCDKKFFEKGNYGKYQTTEEAGAVAFYPAPNTPLEGKIKFSFKETMPAEGNKGPDNPSIITGVTKIDAFRAAINLIPKTFSPSYYNLNSELTLIVNQDGSVIINGDAVTNNAYTYLWGNSNDKSQKMVDFSIPKNTEINFLYEYVSGTASVIDESDPPTESNPVAMQILVGDGNDLNASRITISGPDRIATRQYESLKYSKIRIASWKGYRFSNYTVKPYAWFSNAFLDIDKENVNEKFTINFDNTYYGGEIDLVTGVMTINYVICELDGTEWWSSPDNNTLTAYNSTTGYGWSYCVLRNKTGYEPILVKNSVQDPSIISCTHFTNTNYGIGDGSINDGSINYSAIFLAGAQCRFSFPYSTITEWKNYLAAQKTAGIPVKVAYLINDPYTVQLSPIQVLSLTQTDKYTPRLNTVYTDADSIQISYLKSPIRDEYEKTQAILSLGGNS